MDSPSFTTMGFSNNRNSVVDLLSEGMPHHIVHAIIEVDVTEPRRFLAEMKTTTGEAYSFTAFLLHCLGKAIDENKVMHAYRSGGKKLVLFDEVDVATIIEREVDGKKLPISYILRSINKKSVQEMHAEIREAQVAKIGTKTLSKNKKLYDRLPRFMRAMFWWAVRHSPSLQKEYIGTVGLTAVGMFGDGAGWAIPITPMTLTVTVGGIGEKPAVVEGEISIRQMLSLTVSINHDIIDGGPATRFIMRFKHLIEEGSGLIP
jgi:pyruvate/2-oxoglutarate dehydrogenase complex dihydrolipoamide acyltransferase (E2) component